MISVILVGFLWYDRTYVTVNKQVYCSLRMNKHTSTPFYKNEKI